MQPPLASPKLCNFVVFSSFFKISSSLVTLEAFAILEATITMVSAFGNTHANWRVSCIVNFEKWRVPLAKFLYFRFDVFPVYWALEYFTDIVLSILRTLMRYRIDRSIYDRNRRRVTGKLFCYTHGFGKRFAVSKNSNKRVHQIWNILNPETPVSFLRRKTIHLSLEMKMKELHSRKLQS